MHTLDKEIKRDCLILFTMKKGLHVELIGHEVHVSELLFQTDIPELWHFKPHTPIPEQRPKKTVFVIAHNPILLFMLSDPELFSYSILQLRRQTL